MAAAALLLLLGAAAGFFLWKHWRDHRYDGVIGAAAQRYGLDPALVKAMAWQESRFDAAARGKAGELGLLQIRAVAAGEWAAAERVKPFIHEHCLDPRTNALASAWYLKKALNRYKKGEDDPVPYALAEYNAGRRHVLRWRTGAAMTNSALFVEQIGFPSTSNYVRQILARRYAYSRDFPRRN